jgi:uncharacterized protein (UPF0264 family)
MAGLLISVRSAAEALIALAGGADLIDVKEPSLGSLGRANEETLQAVLDVAGDKPISAALGELREWPVGELPPFTERLAHVKWGLARCPDDWREQFARLRQGVEVGSSCRVVLTAYADWRRASSPALADVAHFAIATRTSVLLIDTWQKDGTTLLDWVSVSDLDELVRTAHGGQVQVALGGSLGVREIEKLATVRPEWFAVRGAACALHRRQDELDALRVQRLVEVVRSRAS